MLSFESLKIAARSDSNVASASKAAETEQNRAYGKQKKVHILVYKRAEGLFIQLGFREYFSVHGTTQS